jgi:K+-sensing histidine kinase KdpD
VQIFQYVCNLQDKNKGAFIKGSDIRQVQLFDKIKDNTLDFSCPDTEILFMLDVDQYGNAIIRLKNEGEIITQQQLDVLFHGVVSQRSTETGSPHLGIVLYVAHKIAQFHTGKLQIVNRRDKQGGEVSLILPSIPSK